MHHTPTLVPISTDNHNEPGKTLPISVTPSNTLRIDASALIPSILSSILGSDSKEVLELSLAIEHGTATKHDKRRLIKLLDKASRRLCN